MIDRIILNLVQKKLKPSQTQTPKKTESQSKFKQHNPMDLSESEAQKEQWRRSFFILGILMFLGIVLFQWKGSQWISTLEDGSQNIDSWALIVSSVIVLSVIKVMWDALKGLNKFIPPSNQAEQRQKRLVIKLIVFIFVAQVLFSLLITNFENISETDFFKDIYQMIENQNDFEISP